MTTQPIQFDLGKYFMLLAQAETLREEIKTTKFKTPEDRIKALQTVADLINEAQAIMLLKPGNDDITAADLDRALAIEMRVPTGFNPALGAPPVEERK